MMYHCMIYGALEPLALTGSSRLAAAIIYGMFLGLLLVKCGFADRQQVKDNLTFCNMRLVKTLLLALGVGMFVFALLRSFHAVQDQYQQPLFWGVLIGGICVGLGLGIGGMVPVTAVASLASGRLYAIWSIIGMLLAFPVAGLIKRVAAGAVNRLSAPVNVTMESENGLFSLDSTVLWASGIVLVLVLVIHLLGPSEQE